MIDSNYKLKLLLLHGWGGSKNSLENLANSLKSKYDCHVLEMPGHGSTPEMSVPWDMPSYSLWLKEYIQENNIDKYVLLGHSFGGKIILDSVINKVLSPEKIILIDSNGIKPKNSLKKSVFKFLSGSLSHFLRNPIGKVFRKFIYKYVIRENDYANTSGMIKESFKLFNEQHYDDLLSQVDVPTIIIWGKDDKVTPLWMGEKLNKNIENSKLFVINGTHGIPIKQYSEVAEIILNNT